LNGSDTFYALYAVPVEFAGFESAEPGTPPETAVGVSMEAVGMTAVECRPIASGKPEEAERFRLVGAVQVRESDTSVVESYGASLAVR
jgi:hypothetical protein